MHNSFHCFIFHLFSVAPFELKFLQHLQLFIPYIHKNWQSFLGRGSTLNVGLNSCFESLTDFSFLFNMQFWAVSVGRGRTTMTKPLQGLIKEVWHLCCAYVCKLTTTNAHNMGSLILRKVGVNVHFTCVLVTIYWCTWDDIKQQYSVMIERELWWTRSTHPILLVIVDLAHIQWWIFIFMCVFEI